MNKLVPATSLLWALLKCRVYDYDYDLETSDLVNDRFVRAALCQYSVIITASIILIVIGRSH